MIVHHHPSFILWSVLTLLTTTQPVQCDVSCVTGQFYVGGAGNVTCNFGENVRDTKHNFNIVLYTNPQDSGTYVLLCNWEKDSLECNVKQNYRFDQATTPVTDSLVLEIPTVAESMAGLYVCQLVPDNGIPVHTCQLNVTDPPPTIPPPCTTSKPLIADQGTADQGQKAVIGVLIAVVVCILLVFIVCFVFLWYKFDLVKRGDRVEGSNKTPDGWAQHIYCCKFFPFKRPLGVSRRDDPDSITNKSEDVEPLLPEKSTDQKVGVGDAELGEGRGYNDSKNTEIVGSGIGSGVIKKGAATAAEVAPVHGINPKEIPQKPTAAKENPKDDLKLDKDAKEVQSQNIQPGTDSNIVHTAAKDENPPGEPSGISESSAVNQEKNEKPPDKAPGKPMVSKSATMTQRTDYGFPPTRPDRQSKSGSSPPQSTHSDGKESVMQSETEAQDSGDKRTNKEVAEQQDKGRPHDEPQGFNFDNSNSKKKLLGDNEDAPAVSGETSPEPQASVTTDKCEDQQEEEKRGHEQVKTVKPLEQGISNTDLQDPPAEGTQSDQSDSALRKSDGSQAPAGNSATGDKSVGQTSAEPAKEQQTVQAGNQDESEDVPDTGASGNRDESHAQVKPDDSVTSNSPSNTSSITNSSFGAPILPAHPEDDAPPLSLFSPVLLEKVREAGDSDGSPGVHNVHVKPGEDSPDKRIEDQPDSGKSIVLAHLEDDAPPLSLFSPEVLEKGKTDDSDGSHSIHNVQENPNEESPHKMIKDQPDSGESNAPAPPEDEKGKENVQETTDTDLDEASKSPDNPHSGQSPRPEGASQYSAEAGSVSRSEKKTRQSLVLQDRLNPQRDKGKYRDNKYSSLTRDAELSDKPSLLTDEPLETTGKEALSQANTDIDELVTLLEGAPLTTKVENQDNNTEG